MPYGKIALATIPAFVISFFTGTVLANLFSIFSNGEYFWSRPNYLGYIVIYAMFIGLGSVFLQMAGVPIWRGAHIALAGVIGSIILGFISLPYFYGLILLGLVLALRNAIKLSLDSIKFFAGCLVLAIIVASFGPYVLRLANIYY